MAIQFGGLASGLDTKALIEAILGAERQPLERLQGRIQVYNQQKSALQELNGKLNDFESALRDLASPRRFRGRSTTVSDETVLRATPGAAAETGLFSIEVFNLAAADKVKSNGVASPDQGLIGDGTITIRSGNQDEITIDVSAASGNNSLSAVRDAINTADAGVRAAILFDGSAYRLTVRSEETGLDNALTITDTTDLGLADAGNVVTAAADASLQVDGVDITSGTNTISGTIPGVTLDLLFTTAGIPVTVEVEQDNDGVVDAAGELIDTYNEIVEFLNQQFDRDNPGPLAGDPTARRVQSRLQSLFTSGVDGIEFGNIRSLSAVGVDFDGATGKAKLDTTKLRELLDTNFDAVGNVFLAGGSATSAAVRFLGSTSATAPGTYGITVTQAAAQASVDGATPLTALGLDETLTIEVNGSSLDVTLTAGQTLAEVVDSINAELRDADLGATAYAVGGALRIASNEFGSAYDVSVTSDRNDPGDGSGTGFSTTAATASGTDVAGTIDGVAAVGSGQVLTAADGTAADGLKVTVTATSAYLAANGSDLGNVSFSRGIVASLLDEVRAVTRTQDGPISLATESIDATIRSLNRDIDRQSDKLAARERQLVLTFSAAERAISALQAQQNALGGFQVI